MNSKQHAHLSPRTDLLHDAFPTMMYRNPAESARQNKSFLHCFCQVLRYSVTVGTITGIGMMGEKVIHTQRIKLFVLCQMGTSLICLISAVEFPAPKSMELEWYEFSGLAVILPLHHSLSVTQGHTCCADVSFPQ